jgi:hypothetical protein
MTDLYKFPKDVLIKMLSTIKEDTEKIYLDEISKMQNMMKYIEHCKLKDCFNFIVYSDTPTRKDYKYKNTIFCRCFLCNALYCKDHASGLETFTCISCLNNHSEAH